MGTVDNIAIKRAYDPPSPDDGRRFLIDRVWPRGKRKEDLRCEAWCREVAPSTALRRWFGHELERWEEFQRRYFAELDESPAEWGPLLEAARREKITLVYGARDERHNQAVALAKYLAMHDADYDSTEHHAHV